MAFDDRTGVTLLWSPESTRVDTRSVCPAVAWVLLGPQRTPFSYLRGIVVITTATEWVNRVRCATLVS